MKCKRSMRNGAAILFSWHRYLIAPYLGEVEARRWKREGVGPTKGGSILIDYSHTALRMRAN